MLPRNAVVVGLVHHDYPAGLAGSLARRVLEASSEEAVVEEVDVVDNDLHTSAADFVVVGYPGCKDYIRHSTGESAVLLV